MKKHRIFIAVNLPEQIKKQLYSCKDKWPELPCRWTKKDNLHITLIFLGYLLDEEMLEICGIAKSVAKNHSPFTVTLNKILYGPPYQSKHGTWQAPKKNPPRMVWAEGEKSAEISKLKNDLEKAIAASEDLQISSESRIFSPHITLGRIQAWQFRKMEPEERPEVNEEINLNFEVNSIEVMESELKRGGAEYIILESCPLRS